MKRTKTLRELFAFARSRTVLSYVFAGVLILALIVLAGKDMARHLATFEVWLNQIGPWGIFAFVAFFVLATSFLIPETVLSIMAGAVFGFAWGLVAVVMGSLLAATLQYAVSRKLLRGFIGGKLATRPALLAIQHAVMRDEMKLQMLLRLTPLNPATISYMLGAAGVRIPGFLLASLALIPATIIEVYFGYAGKHVAHMSGRASGKVYLHDLVVLVGLAVTVFVVVLVSRTAHRAVLTAVSQNSADEQLTTTK